MHLAPICGGVQAREAMIAAEKRLQLIQEALRAKVREKEAAKEISYTPL